MSHEESPLGPQGAKVEGSAGVSTHPNPHLLLEGSGVLQVVVEAVESVRFVRSLDGLATAAALKW